MPWVAVEMAPASVWASMSPWFSIARPSSASRLPSSCRVIPACTVTKPLERSASSTRSIAPMSISTPSVQAVSVNEWPEPATRTGSPSATAAATAAASCSSDAGRSIRTGAQRCWPAQLVQISVTGGL